VVIRENAIRRNKKGPYWWRRVKVCRGFIWERRGVCQWNGRVKFNRAGVRSRRDAEKSGREPF